MTTRLTDASANSVTINGNNDNVNLTDTSDSNVTIAGNRDDVSLTDVSDASVTIAGNRDRVSLTGASDTDIRITGNNDRVTGDVSLPTPTDTESTSISTNDVTGVWRRKKPSNGRMTSW